MAWRFTLNSRVLLQSVSPHLAMSLSFTWRGWELIRVMISRGAAVTIFIDAMRFGVQLVRMLTKRFFADCFTVGFSPF